MSVPQQPLKFYDFEKSGHAHRARLMAALLGLPYELRPVDLANGEIDDEEAQEIMEEINDMRKEDDEDEE